MPQFLSNTYLVGTPGAEAVFIDAGGPVAPLVAEAERQGLTPTHVLLTHHHHDHVAELGALRERWPGITVLAHPDEAALVEGEVGPITNGSRFNIVYDLFRWYLTHYMIYIFECNIKGCFKDQ